MFERFIAFMSSIDVPAFLPAVLIAFAISVGGYSLFSIVVTNRPQQKKMEEWRDVPPLLFRLFKPVVLLFSNEVRNLMKDELYTKSQKRLSAAGMNYAIMPEEFLTLKLVCFVVASVSVTAVYNIDQTLGPEALIILFSIVALGYFYPDIWLTDRIGSRRRMVSKDFPFMLDLLVLSMRAGLNYSSSLAQAISSLPAGPVKDEFGKLLREIRAGKSRREALLDLAERMDVNPIHNFVAAMNQAEETGGEIVDVLTAQAEQRRTERFNTAEEVANKAPIKMLIPMMAFLFPIIFMLLAFVMIVKLAEIDALPESLLRLLLS